MRTLALLSVLVVAGPAAAAQNVEIPSSPSSGPAPGAAPAPPAPAAPARAAAPRRAATVALRLRIGSRGSAVRDLQRALRRRGMRIAVDGAFGPATKKAVRRMQKRMRMRPTGIADARLLRRLGLRTRIAAAATPAPARPATPATTAPGLAAPGSSKYLDAFPVVGDYTYSHDFGAPRHQGRHEGIDIMADRGTPLVAVSDGTISRLTRSERGLGGLYVWLERADGTDYYYAHMHSIAAGLDAGSTVSAGQVIGTVGNTGDARYGAPHLHFEIRPAGSSPIDPYSHLMAVDPQNRAQARR